MRKLTFLGFLREYVKHLSEQNTTNIYKLTCECSRNPRLRESLFLYALESEKLGLLEKAAATSHEDLLAGWARQYSSRDSMKHLLETYNSSLPANFQKVWRTYDSLANRTVTDNHTKELMRQKIIALQGKSGVSNYRLYTDLKMNPGNMNAWLKHGDSSKVSLQAARTTLHYMQGQVSAHL